MQTKVRLDEVTLMRCVLALLIVFMHSFTCYNGSWSEPEGYIDVPLYKWVTRISFAFALESFVFVSGYLFAFQLITLKRESGVHMLTNKIKRLILPSILFSILYFILFYQYEGVLDMVYRIINGCGHMWYLPMIFWCFVGGALLIKVHIRDIYKLVFLALLNLCVIFSLPLRISSAFTYLFYFQLGYTIYQHRDAIQMWVTKKKLFFMWLFFIVVFVCFRPLRDLCFTNFQVELVKSVILSIADNMCQFIYAGVGVVTFFCTALFYTQHSSLKPFTILLASTCFGIYLFQQFFLQILYYKTSFPVLVGPYLLPWCGFIIVLVLSFGCSWLLLKTKVGKSLIG